MHKTYSDTAVSYKLIKLNLTHMSNLTSLLKEQGEGGLRLPDGTDGLLAPWGGL